jgi:hypothetical protein
MLMVCKYSGLVGSVHVNDTLPFNFHVVVQADSSLAEMT